MKKCYEPPMSVEDIIRKYGEDFARKLLKDPVHYYRATIGIELIHKEPTLKELNRIWENWQLMDNIEKAASNKKSRELFGMNNEEHYYKLLEEY